MKQERVLTLSSQGSGGVAGFAKGGADVEVEPHPDGTLLRYNATAEISGKLAQLGNRLIEGTAKKLSEQFFQNFAGRVALLHKSRGGFIS
jgi:uncharacterized protein